MLFAVCISLFISECFSQLQAQNATDKLFGGSSAATSSGMVIVDKVVVFVDDYSPVSRMGIL